MSINRVSTRYDTNSAIRRMANIERKIADKSRHLSGERYTTFNEISNKSDFSVIADINKDVIESDSCIRNSKMIHMKTAVMSRSIKDIMDVAQQYNNYLILNTNYLTMDTTSLNMLAEDSVSTVAHLLNVRVADDYLFSGSAINVLPVKVPVENNFGDYNSTDFDFYDEPNTNYYSGDDLKKSVYLDTSLRVEYGIPASNDAFRNIIASMNIGRVLDGENSDLVNRAINLLQKGLEELSVLRMKVLKDSSLADEVVSRRMDYKSLLNERQDMVDERHGLDLMGLMVEYNQYRNVLNASMQSFSSSAKLSILNYLK